MEKFIAAILVSAGVAALVFFGVVMRTVFGAITGWAVYLLFPETFGTAMKIAHIESMELWQVGAVLGFVGGYFSVSSSSKAESK